MSQSQTTEDATATPTVDAVSSLGVEANEALAAIGADDADALEAWRVEFLGRNGRLTGILRGLSSLPQEERRRVGAAANGLKNSLELEYGARLEAVAQAKRAPAGALDVTLPGRRWLQGRFHPVTQTIRDLADAFTALGFQIAEGPEIEWDYYNFTMLNIPSGHPARDMFDTFFIDRGPDERGRRMVLRSHTSPMQARIMEQTDPPIRVMVPGRCFRYEATDATHEWHLHQLELLAVDEGITLADLKGTLYEFARRIFGPDRKVRFRCDFFPFVEPGVDMAIDCFKCNGAGCSICGQSGWIEILGAGMVHPNVLEAAGYDSDRYTGFAAGIGIERTALLRHGIDDIRLFASNDLRFLSQF